MASGTMLFTELDLSQVHKLITVFVKTMEKEVGKGDSSQQFLGTMAQEAHDWLHAITHRFTHTLYKSYIVDTDESPMRGIYDPGGLIYTLHVDPTVINPLGNYPDQYAAVEFSRGDEHDAFGRVMAQTDRLVDRGWAAFEKSLSTKLGF